MKLVIAATGASGTIYLQRLLSQVDCAANEVHLVMSGHAKQVAAQEVERLVVPAGVSEHGENDLNVDSWRARTLLAFGFGLYRLWARTLRLQVDDPHGVVEFVRNQPVIFAIWHNRLLMLPRVFDPTFPTRQSFGLISASRDGDLIA